MCYLPLFLFLASLSVIMRLFRILYGFLNWVSAMQRFYLKKFWSGFYEFGFCYRTFLHENVAFPIVISVVVPYHFKSFIMIFIIQEEVNHYFL